MDSWRFFAEREGAFASFWDEREAALDRAGALVFAADFADLDAGFDPGLSDLGFALAPAALETFAPLPPVPRFDPFEVKGWDAVFADGRFPVALLGAATDGRVDPDTVFASSNETIFACPANGIPLPSASCFVCSVFNARS